jgi:hypothetical protein
VIESVVCWKGEVCEEGFSFASLSIAIHRRFSERSFVMVPQMKSVRGKTIGGIKSVLIMNG